MNNPKIFKEIAWKPYPAVDATHPAKAPIGGINWGVGGYTKHPTEAFEAGSAQAAPDATWIFGDALWVCWEAKSDASADSTIATAKVREANGHIKYVEDRRANPAPAGSFTCYATPQKVIDHTAKAVCNDDIYHVPEHAAAELAGRVQRALVSSRKLGPGVDDAGVLAALKAESCLPSQWIVGLTRQRLNRLGEPGE